MRRDHFTLTAVTDESDADGEPTLVVTYDGPPGTLTERLLGETGEAPAGDELDAAFRLQTPADDPEATGVFSLTRRLTGEYLLEGNADAESLLAVVDAARDNDDERYRIRIERPNVDPITYEKETLLVYDADGSLLRHRSLIPSGVEL
jgi:hypothetical protein